MYGIRQTLLRASVECHKLLKLTIICVIFILWFTVINKFTATNFYNQDVGYLEINIPEKF